MSESLPDPLASTSAESAALPKSNVSTTTPQDGQSASVPVAETNQSGASPRKRGPRKPRASKTATLKSEVKGAKPKTAKPKRSRAKAKAKEAETHQQQELFGTSTPAPVAQAEVQIIPPVAAQTAPVVVQAPVAPAPSAAPVVTAPAPVPAVKPAPVKKPEKIELPESFAKLGLENQILHALGEIHFKTPSEIQEKLIPLALTGKDIIGQARTGTGKTAAFGLPILQRLNLEQPFQAIVVVPTRELAVQVEAELVRFAKHKPIRFALAYGGTKIGGQIKVMSRQPHVVVGTPGRILDLMERQVLPLDNMKFVVCDEVDRMFDIGFRDDIRRILGACTSEHQTIFVSATINDDIEHMVARHMKNPERVFTSSPDEQLTNPEARQFYLGVEPWDKQRALRMLIKHEKPHLAIIFCRTKRSVDKVAAGLNQDGVNASPIHGDLMQNKRERVMRGFRTGKINVLVATDLASRGIDVHEVSHVVNYDIPEDPEAYVHRVGRTARMGATGMSVTFVSRGQGQLQTEIEKLTNHLMEEYKIPGFEPRPEPNAKPGSYHHSQSATPTEAHSAQPQSVTPEGTPSASPVPAPAPAQEGYMPTGFGHVKLEQSFRPISGKFKTKRR